MCLPTNSADGVNIREQYKARCLNQSERVLHWHIVKSRKWSNVNLGLNKVTAVPGN